MGWNPMYATAADMESVADSHSILEMVIRKHVLAVIFLCEDTGSIKGVFRTYLQIISVNLNV